MYAIRLVQIPKIGREIGQKYGNFEKVSNFCLKNHTFWQFLTLATYPHLSTSQNGLIYIFIVNIFFAMTQNVKSTVWSNCEKSIKSQNPILRYPTEIFIENAIGICD